MQSKVFSVDSSQLTTCWINSIDNFVSTYCLLFPSRLIWDSLRDSQKALCACLDTCLQLYMHILLHAMEGVYYDILFCVLAPRLDIGMLDAGSKHMKGKEQVFYITLLNTWEVSVFWKALKDAMYSPFTLHYISPYGPEWLGVFFHLSWGFKLECVLCMYVAEWCVNENYGLQCGVTGV